MRARDAGALVVLAALWGSSFAFIRIAVPSFGPVGLVVARVALGAGLLWAFSVALRRPVELRPYAGRLLVLAALNAALPYILISAAELQITASFAAVLTATVPLFAAVFGFVWLDERLTLWRIAGLVGGVIGVALMVGWSPVAMTGSTGLAIAAMLVGSACYAGAGIYTRLRLAGVPVHALALGQQLGTIVWLIVPLIVWTPSRVPPAAAVWAVVALAVLSTAVAYLLYFRLIDRIGPTKTSTVTYLLPFFGLLWGISFLEERVTFGMIAGLALILASVALVNEVRVVSRSPAMTTPTRRPVPAGTTARVQQGNSPSRTGSR